MKIESLALPLFFVSMIAFADAQILNEETAKAYLNQSCLKNIESMLIGFSIPYKPLKEDVSKTCDCMEESLQGKSWESQQKLDLALVDSAHVCAKPIAHSYSKKAINFRMAPLFTAKKWSQPQIETYLDCFADGHWSLSVERKNMSNETQQEAVGKLLKDCETRASEATK